MEVSRPQGSDRRFDFYLDTSAINRLYDHALSADIDPPHLARSLGKRYRFLVSAVNVGEIFATGDAGRRRGLLRFCYELSPGGPAPGEKVMPADLPGELLRRSARAYAAREKGFNITVEQGRAGPWYGLVFPEKVDDDAVAECREYLEREKKWYREMHQNGRRALQEFLRQEKEFPRDEKSFMSMVAEPEFQNRSLLVDLLQDLCPGHRPSDLLTDICVWRVWHTVFMYEIYHRGIKPHGYGEDKNPGSLDVQQAVYLCFVRAFVTADRDQLEHFRDVIRYAGIDVRALSFEEFAAQYLEPEGW